MIQPIAAKWATELILSLPFYIFYFEGPVMPVPFEQFLLQFGPQRRYMLQLLERPAYQCAFGAGTAEQLQTIVTLGIAWRHEMMQLDAVGGWTLMAWLMVGSGREVLLSRKWKFEWDGKAASGPDRPRIILWALSCDSDSNIENIEACGGYGIRRYQIFWSLDTRQT